MSEPTVFPLADQVAYQTGSVVSRKVLGSHGGNVTLFAFAEGEGLTEHTSPFEALVLVLDGEAAVRIGEEDVIVPVGSAIRLPPAVPHALEARKAFKMMLVMIRE